jgi:hypothetical protein
MDGKKNLKDLFGEYNRDGKLIVVGVSGVLKPFG